MAIDQQAKRRKLVAQLAEQSALLMNNLYALDALRRQRDSGGPNGTALAFTDADFTGQTGLTHLDAAIVNACFTAIQTVTGAFVSNGFDDTFEAMRP